VVGLVRARDVVSVVEPLALRRAVAVGDHDRVQALRADLLAEEVLGARGVGHHAHGRRRASGARARGMGSLEAQKG
jgi:hypothetical protein